jgi:hypothetical protein
VKGKKTFILTQKSVADGFYMWVTGLGFCGLLGSGLAFEPIHIFFESI